MSVRLKCLSPRPMATTRLLCIPYAGAGAGAFRGWSERLPAHVEAYAVQLPAREDRLSAAAMTAWPAMFDSLVAAVGELHPQRTAIFGHSLGAVIALELARWMARMGGAPVQHLFVSARPWPGQPPMSLRPIWSADDDAMLAAMDRRFGSMATNLAHPDIRDVVLPALRADLQLLDDHRYATSAALRCPLTVFTGLADPTTPDDVVDGWRQETTTDFEKVTFDGGHFFVDTHKDDVVAAVAERLPAERRW